MPTFTGDKATYRNFMMIFEAWEDKEDIRRSTSMNLVADLPTDAEYWTDVRSRERIDVNGNIVVQDDPLTDEEKQL